MNHEFMPNFLRKRAFLTPDRTAIYFDDVSVTFQELYQRSYQAAGKLQRQGIRKNQYVGILLKNHLDTVILLFALQLLGVKAVILNNRLTSTELAWQLTDSKAAFLISEAGFSEMYQKLKTSTIIKEELFLSEMETPIIREEISLEDVCTVMYTSGTTGNPKGVMQTFGNHWWSAVGSALNLGFADSDCWLCSVPLFHISGYSIIMRSVIYGMPIVLHEKFDPAKTIEDISGKRVTIMSVVTATMAKIIDELKGGMLPPHFRCMLLGGGPAPLPLLKECVGKEIPVFQTYGMTETSSQIVTLSPEYSLTKLGSAGKPLFPAQIRIELENGETAGPGEAGEIVLKGPNVTIGYLNRPEDTRDKLLDGWLCTGDIGYLDEDGFLFVLDRRSDLIISGGENIYPAEIEAVLHGHPNVADVGVTGIEDVKWGQVPIAFIVRKEGSSLVVEELVQFCLEHLAKYKIPKEFRFVDQLPRNAANKLLRRKLLDGQSEGSVKG